MIKSDEKIDQNNIHNNIQKNKIVRLKFLRFKTERETILKKILDLIGITDTNKIFFSHILDEKENVQKQIIDMVDDIKKYFKVSSWSTFKPNIIIERKYLSIIKSVLHDMNIKFTCDSMKTKYNDKTVNTTMYTLLK